jgi:molybdopterin molybdotransferase
LGPLNATEVLPEEAWHRLRGLLSGPVGWESLNSLNSLGRFLAQDVCSPQDVPAYDQAQMDGYALKSLDLQPGKSIRVMGCISAGETWEKDMEAGSAVRVMTGAPLPLGTDVVLPMEEASPETGGSFSPEISLPPWANVAKRGFWASSGERILQRGERVGPQELSVLANVGLQRVRVFKRPRVRVVVTGSELIPPGGGLKHGQVFSSHGWYIRSLVQKEGGRAFVDGPLPDDEGQIRDAIAEDKGEQLLVTTGGTGGGDRDLISKVLSDMGARALFNRIKMRPGRTISLHFFGHRPVICLPGGAGGLYLGFQFLVAPALQLLRGDSILGGQARECFTQDDLTSDPCLFRFLEAVVQSARGRLLASVLPRRPRGWGLSSRHGVAWIEVPPGQGVIPKGSLVRVHWKGTGLHEYLSEGHSGDLGAPT